MRWSCKERGGCALLCSGALCQAAMIATELCRGKKWSRQHEARYLCSVRQGIAKKHHCAAQGSTTAKSGCLVRNR